MVGLLQCKNVVMLEFSTDLWFSNASRNIQLLSSKVSEFTVCELLRCHCHHYHHQICSVCTIQHGHLPRKPGKVGEFDIGQGKVREIVVCLRCATAVTIATK